VKEVFISFAVFVICVSLTIFSQFNSPQVVNAAESEPQLVQQTPKQNQQMFQIIIYLN